MIMAEGMAQLLAREIYFQRNGLDNEDKLANGDQLRSYARAKKWRDQDRAKINGMVIALTFMLGDPSNMKLAEDFIAQSFPSSK